MANILYIEDIDDNAALVERVISGRGHRFRRANNAEEGLEMALAEQPDLILLDLGLPDVDGQTLSIWLRSEPTLQNIPIVVLTAWPEETARMTVEQYRLDGYLSKPLNIRQLAELVEKLLSARSS